MGNDFTAFQKEKMDKGPVVSGPYNLDSYSSEKVVLKRRDDYWGNAALRGNKKPAPRSITSTRFTRGNDHFSVALQQGNLDVSMTYIPRIWIEVKDNVGTCIKRNRTSFPDVFL